MSASILLASGERGTPSRVMGCDVGLSRAMGEDSRSRVRGPNRSGSRSQAAVMIGRASRSSPMQKLPLSGNLAYNPLPPRSGGLEHAEERRRPADSQFKFNSRRLVMRVVRRKQIGDESLALWLMLEDDLDRIDRFNSIVARHHRPISLSIERTAPSFINRYQELAVIPDLICLDHDLMPDCEGDPDPGDGRDVSRFLTTRLASSPVLIHSTNSAAADSMMFSMREHGWTVDRISPIGEDWIESYWFPSALDIVARFRA